MNQIKWLQKANDNREVLIDFLRIYHPHSRIVGNSILLPITAPNAEMARQNVVNAIKAEGSQSISPVEQFNIALKNKNWLTINSLLNSAWFGVPESTSCWGITGFTEAVELMEDTPGEDQKEEGEE